MLKFIKKVIILTIHLTIIILYFTIKSLHHFIEKNKTSMKKIIKKVDAKLVEMI